MAPLNYSIETYAVAFSYTCTGKKQSDVKALDGVCLNIKKGEYVAVIGRNGSGKTTFARLLNGLLLPTEGVVRICGIDTCNNEQIWNIRRLMGMVFQDTDSQIIGTTVEEDVAFGPENIGLPPEEIRNRVQEALFSVSLVHHSHTAPHLLSGGEKQRVSLAGLLAMQPECIILDEATALLDPTGRKEILGLVRSFNKKKGITVLHSTHDMEEARLADRIIVLDAGKIVLNGTPDEVFSQRAVILEAGLELPQIAELFYQLRQEGFELPKDAFTIDEALEMLVNVLGRGREQHVYQH